MNNETMNNEAIQEMVGIRKMLNSGLENHASTTFQNCKDLFPIKSNEQRAMALHP